MTNKNVIKMYKGQPYLETTIQMLTPISEELKNKIAFGFQDLPQVLQTMDDEIQNKLKETFESDILLVNTRLVNTGLCFGKEQNEVLTSKKLNEIYWEMMDKYDCFEALFISNDFTPEFLAGMFIENINYEKDDYDVDEYVNEYSPLRFTCNEKQKAKTLIVDAIALEKGV